MKLNKARTGFQALGMKARTGFLTSEIRLRLLSQGVPSAQTKKSLGVEPTHLLGVLQRPLMIVTFSPFMFTSGVTLITHGNGTRGAESKRGIHSSHVQPYVPCFPPDHLPIPCLPPSCPLQV